MARRDSTSRLHVAWVLGAVLAVGLGLVGQASGQCNPPQLAKLIASDAAAGDQFGESVALEGSTALIGAPYDDNAGGTNAGAVYVLVLVGQSWIEQAKLTAPDGTPAANFGCAVALDGGVALIGAIGSNGGAGAAYVFSQSGGVWAQEAKLVAANGIWLDRFGAAVSLHGDTAVIGAPDRDSGPNDTGAAYVFRRVGTTWTQETELTAQEVGVFDHFGVSVAVHNDTALIGASSDSSAYAFVRSGGVWTQETKLNGSILSPWFGASVALNDDYAVIGAPGVNAGDGMAYVFLRSGATWTEQTWLMATNAGIGKFGNAVALRGGHVVVGAYHKNIGGVGYVGAAYVYIEPAGGWPYDIVSESGRLVASDPDGDDELGYSVALNDSLALSGAHLDDNAGVDAGSAYVFSLTCTSPVCLGDLNCGGVVDFGDINPFVLILSDPTAWQQTYPGCPPLNGDIDGNGTAGFEDINPFVALIVQSPTPCGY